MYAIVKTGGKQYTVKPGDVLDVEKLDGEAGDKVSLELSPYDLSKGRINFRHIEGRTPPAAHAPRRR